MQAIVSLVVVFNACTVQGVNIVKWHVDASNTGVNNRETTLTPQNVQTDFGKLFSYKVDGHVYTQPLVVQNVWIPSWNTAKDVVFVATEANTVYAFDAYSPSVIWQRTLGFPVDPEDVSCNNQIKPVIGVTGTPVIDLRTGTLYVSSKTKDPSCKPPCSNIAHTLHALDIGTGNPKPNSPIGIGGLQDGVRFLPGPAHQRAALTLCGGAVYISFASHCDVDPFHGWVFAYDKTSLQLRGSFVATPTAAKMGDEWRARGGIWMAGGAIAHDSQCTAFVPTGNGGWDGIVNFGDTVLKLTMPQGGKLKVLDWFTPHDQEALQMIDQDVSSTATVLMTVNGKALALQGGKQGKLYLLQQGNMGHMSPNDQNTYQTLDLGSGRDSLYGTPAFFNNRLYVHAHYEGLKVFQFGADGRLQTSPVMQTDVQFDYPGASPSISAYNGHDGIVWEVHTCLEGSCDNPTHAILYAWDANTLAPLWNSDRPADALAGAVKFTFPTIANGRVYTHGQYGVDVFGLK